MQHGRFGLSLAAMLLIVAAAAGEASAQTPPPQVITWTQANQTGLNGWQTGTYLCVTNNRTLYNSNQPLDITWTDTTGAPVGAVRIDLSINWQYLYSPAPVFNVAVNNIQQSGTLAPNGTLQNCSANTLTQSSYETDITVWNPNGANTLRLTPTTTTYASINVNQSFMIQIVVTQLNLPPDLPSNLGQIGSDGKGIGVGGMAGGGSLTLRATVSDPDADDCFLEAEVAPPTTFFPGTPNYTGTPSPSGSYATISLTGLPEGPYHWRVRSVDEFNVETAWVSFGGNSEIVPDFIVASGFAPPKPIDNVNHGGGDCTISAGAWSGALSPALFGAALFVFALGRARRRR